MKKKFIALSLAVTISVSAMADTQQVESALKNNDLPAAEIAFSSLTKQEKISIEGEILKGRILLEKDEYENAYDHFDELRDDHMENIDVNYYLGVSAMVMAQTASIFSKLGYAKDFVKAMEKAITLKPDHLGALNYLIGFYLGAPSIAGGDADKALHYANQLKTYDEEKGINQLANVYWQTEKSELADKTIEEGLERFPESYHLYFARASAKIKNEDWKSARQNLVHAIKFAKDDDEKSRALYQQGKVSAESSQELEVGIQALIEAEPIADKNYKPWVNYRLAQLYILKKDAAKAKESLAKIDVSDDDDLKGKVKKLKKKLKQLN